MTVRSIAEALLVQAQKVPDAPAFIHRSSSGPIALSWRELASAAARHIATLDEFRLKHGDRVLTAIPNSLTWILTDLACQLRGWIHVAVDPQLPASRVDALIRQTSPRAVIQRPIDSDDLLMDRMKSVDQALPVPSQAIDIEDAAQILFTSGTTGEQKGVVLSHRNLLSNASAKLEAAPQFRDDLRLNILPFSHAYARTCELSSWILSGCSMAIARDWNHFCRIAPELQPTLVNLVPHLVDRAHRQIVENGKAWIPDAAAELWGRRLRLLQVGGAALRAETWNFFADLGLPPLQGYGLTETSPVICSNRAGSQRCGSVGPPVRDVEVRIDEEKQLWTRGPHIMLGYWQNDEATRVRLADGWFNTGDLAECESDGAIRIIGRADDVLVLSTGYKVSPNELLRMIGDTPLVQQLLIVGQGRPYVGALIVPTLDAPPLDTAIFLSRIREIWREKLSELPRALHIETIGILPEPMTIENGCLNFKGAVRRKHAEDYYADAVERLYASGSSRNRQFDSCNKMQ